jgi:hypothetical protein
MNTIFLNFKIGFCWRPAPNFGVQIRDKKKSVPFWQEIKNQK